MQGDAAGAVGPGEFVVEEGEEGFFVAGGDEVGLVVEAGDGRMFGEGGLGVGLDAHRAIALATKVESDVIPGVGITCIRMYKFMHGLTQHA